MNELISAQLDIVAGKARLLAERYRVGTLFESDLEYMVRDLERELQQITKSGQGANEVSSRVQRASTQTGVWFPDDK